MKGNEDEIHPAPVLYGGVVWTTTRKQESRRQAREQGKGRIRLICRKPGNTCVYSMTEERSGENIRKNAASRK